MEFSLTELSVTEKTFELPVKISNFEELRQALTPKLEFYKSLVVTEDSIKSAKSDKADLNKWKKAIDEERKKIKNRYLTPYKAIEDECEQLIALIDKPITLIDSQLKAFDKQALQAKRAVLEEHFRAENPPDFVSLDDILPEKWKNKTEKAENLKIQMTAKIFQIKSDFEHLQSMYSASPLWTAIFRKYTETKDKSETLSYAVELERSETHGNAPVSNSVSGNVIIPPEQQTGITSHSDSSQTISGVFRATCTVQQLKNLCNFMLQNNIKFEVIKEENSNG